MAIVCMCVSVMICVTKRFSGFYVFTIWRFNRGTGAKCVEAPRADLRSQSSKLVNAILCRRHVESCDLARPRVGRLEVRHDNS